MYNFDQIRTLDLEITNTCNAFCPQCLRTNEDTDIPTNYTDVLNFDQVNANIPPEFWTRLTDINFNGNTGDCIAHPDAQNIIAKVLDLAPQATVLVRTNGSLRNTAWWTEFGSKIKNKNCDVVFGIDGLADTHSLYRVGTSWDKIIKNARAFIDAGGNAVWQMIVFKHNQHQTEQCRQLAKELGFKKFFLLTENRFPNGKTEQPVFFKKKQTHTIQSPTDVALTDSDQALDICTSMENLNSSAPVKCKSMSTGWIAIYADGTVWPCCFLMGWHKSPHQGRFFNLINYHFKRILSIDFLSTTLYTNKLQDIVNSELWQQRFPASFGKQANPVCIQQCSIKYDSN